MIYLSSNSIIVNQNYVFIYLRRRTRKKTSICKKKKKKPIKFYILKQTSLNNYIYLHMVCIPIYRHIFTSTN